MQRGLVITTLVALFTAGLAVAQTGGGYDLNRSTIDGGGATSSGGAFRVAGTAGQPDAGTMSGGRYQLDGGFWPAVLAAATVTPTSTREENPTPTPTRAPTVTPMATSAATATQSATPVEPPQPTDTATPGTVTTSTPTSTGGEAPTTTPTPTDTPPVAATPTATAPVCVGDCRHDGTVTVDEVITGVNIALGALAVDVCTAFDSDGNGMVTIDELITGVNNALNGCPVAQVCGGIAGLPCPTGQGCELPPGTCQVADQQGVCESIPVPCPAPGASPVCGCDGITYDSDCIRKNSGVAKDHDGACT